MFTMVVIRIPSKRNITPVFTSNYPYIQRITATGGKKLKQKVNGFPKAEEPRKKMRWYWRN